ncbi:MAG: peptidylprolyl isomerase [Holophaga sp.]|nr:peptidylprolyl isomerase [Holophaga sp.]
MLRQSLITLTAAFLAAQTPAPEVAKPAPVKVEAPKPMPAKVEAPPKEDKVLARVGNRTFRESDFELFLSMALNPQQRMQVEMVQGAKDQYRKQFLDFKVMETKARKDGMDKGPEYQKKRELMEAQVLIQALMKRDSPALEKKVVVGDADVKAYFDKNQDKFKSPESFNARHLLISLKPGEKGQGEEEAKAKLAKVQEALKAGKKLEELTKEFSDDPGSKEKGGLYENISYGSFVPEFEAAVRKQDIGMVGEPVKTQFGYHLIQVEKRTASAIPAFDTIKDQVRQKAQSAKQEEVLQAYVDGLKKEIGFMDGAAVTPSGKESQKTTQEQGKPTKKIGTKK